MTMFLSRAPFAAFGAAVGEVDNAGLLEGTRTSLSKLVDEGET